MKKVRHIISWQGHQKLLQRAQTWGSEAWLFQRGKTSGNIFTRSSSYLTYNETNQKWWRAWISL